MMGLIYSRAQQTLVWLGPASHDSNLAMSFITSIIQAFINLADADVVTVRMLLQQTGTEQDSPPGSHLARRTPRPPKVPERLDHPRSSALPLRNRAMRCTLPWNDIGDVIEHLYTHRLSHLIKKESSPSSPNELTSGASTV